MTNARAVSAENVTFARKWRTSQCVTKNLGRGVFLPSTFPITSVAETNLTLLKLKRLSEGLPSLTSTTGHEVRR